jgi:amino-acid N-acetyltransferase
MLARPINYVYENIRDFFVALNDNGSVIGCAALHVVGWEGLAELKSLGVYENTQKKGVGKELVEACMDEARSLGVKKVFALTFVDGFFHKMGFTTIAKEQLPHKIWSDCVNCPFFPDCSEIAVIRSV